MQSAAELPLVTIGVFCFNQGRFAADCLASVSSQQYPNIEIIVVDDGSADDSVEVIRGLLASDVRLSSATVIADGENHGLHHRINEVLQLATGEWVMWLAIDDRLRPTTVSELFEASQRHTGADILFGNLAVMDVDGVSKGYARPRHTWQGPIARRYSTPQPAWPGIMRVNNFVSGGMSLLRRSSLLAAGGYHDEARTEDLNMWLTLGDDANFLYVDTITGDYRIVPGSKSRRERVHILDQAHLYRRHAERHPSWRAGLARLTAMRWALSFARDRGRVSVSFDELARESGFSKAELLRRLPAAAIRPVTGSIAARLRMMLTSTARRGL